MYVCREREEEKIYVFRENIDREENIYRENIHIYTYK